MKGLRTLPLLRGQRGVAAIEFALVFVFILLPLLIGIIEFSLAYYNKAVITNACREGAREGIAVNDPYLTEAEIGNIVNQYVAERLITFGPTNNPVTVAVPNDGVPPANGLLRVTVSYQYEFLVLPRFVSEIAGDVLNLTAETVMMYQGVLIF